MLTRYVQLRYLPRPWPSKRYCNGTEEGFRLVIEHPEATTESNSDPSSTSFWITEKTSRLAAGTRPETERA